MIDKEHITGLPDNAVARVIAIYKVENNLISEVKIKWLDLKNFNEQ